MSGQKYAPRPRPGRVTAPEEFRVAAVGLDHGHIYGMCHALREAGAGIAAVYDTDPERISAFLSAFPEARPAASVEAVLEDQAIDLVASAAIPSRRGSLGQRVQEAGKHFFVDKPPFTTYEQLQAARRSCESTGKKWAVCYTERLLSEAAVFASQLLEEGAIGRVVQVLGLGPHKLRADERRSWFFRREEYGGILTDIGSHQVEQFLHYSGAREALVLSSQVGNIGHPEYPELEDFGEACLKGDNGTAGYFRVDWFTPEGLSTWGDGRTFILGTRGYIELRKYVDLAREKTTDHCYLVDANGEHHFSLAGEVGFPYFGALIEDCINGSESAMLQDHAFKAAEIALLAQQKATLIEGKEAEVWRGE